MAQRTQLFQMLPWAGGVETSQDESMIGANKLTIGDNIMLGTRSSKLKREGIAQNWDGAANTAASIVGGLDFWFGLTARTQKQIGITSTRAFYSYSGGVRSTLTQEGLAWSGTLANASLLAFNNQALVAVSGTDNTIKKWDGTGNAQDLRNVLDLTVVSRGSAGTTRTLILSKSFVGIVGDYIVVESSANTNYNGTWQVDSITTSSLTNDTLTFTASGALTEGTTADAAMRVQLLAPFGSFLVEHLGRVWTNDKNNKDLLHFCTTGNSEEWGGWGDSGALIIGQGDGDPEGIIGAFKFKGDLYVGKRTKLYRITGYTPEEFQIILVSDGIGMVSPSAIAPTEDDVYWVSDKGVHALSATEKFGNVSSQFVSRDIQKTFNEDFSRPRFQFIKAGYIPEENCIAFAVTEENSANRTNTTGTVNNTIWWYNTERQEWFRWSDIPCESLIVATDTDRKRLYLGSHTGRLIKTFTGNRYDVNTAGTQVAIKYKVSTGLIFPDSNPYAIKGFKRFILFYKPQGRHTLSVSVKIDNNSLNTENSLSFSFDNSGTPLGAGFVLGSTALGSSVVFGPQMRHIDGIGRSCKITIEQNGIDEDVEIQGFAIEYEPLGPALAL